MIPQLRNGCCGCSLQTSALVIVWISVVMSVTCLAILDLGGTAVIANGLDVIFMKDDPRYFKDTALLSIVLAVCIGIMIICLLISIGLLVVIYKRNYCQMMPYLILSGAMNVLNFLGSVFIFLTIIRNPIMGFWWFIILYGTPAALSCYFWLILYSFHMEIKFEKNVNEV